MLALKVVFGLIGGLFLSVSSLANDLKKNGVTTKAISDNLSVRQEADDKSAVVLTLKKGDEVSVFDRRSSYWKVRTKDGKEGFVSMTGLQPKAGLNSIKESVQNAKSQGGSSSGPSAKDQVKNALSSTVEGAKAKQDGASEKAKDEKKALPANLEKAAGGLFKK